MLYYKIVFNIQNKNDNIIVLNIQIFHIQNCYIEHPNGQFTSKMDLPLEKVSKIPLGALTTQ